MPAQPPPSRQHKPASPGEFCHNVRASHAVNISLQEALSGQMFLVRGALQHCGMLEPVRQMTFSAVAETVSSRIAHDLANRGLEQLHTLVTLPQASAVRSALETRLMPLSAPMALAFLDLLARQSAPIYLCKHFGVRIMMPQDAIAAYRSALEDAIGFMLPHDLHMDSWYNTGVNSINLWIAVSRVRRGNGLLIYPEVYGKEIEWRGGSIDPDARLGTPVNFEMEAGDVLVFAGDHLHSSEPNVTNETRYVLTKRISLGAPRYSMQGNGWVPYYDTRLLGTALEPLASLRSRLSLSYTRTRFRGVLKRAQ